MKKEQQRIKIAEACGWTDCHMPAASNQSMPFTERVLCGIAPGKRVHSPLPDYLNDLNAIHEAEVHTGMHYDQRWVEIIVEISFRESTLEFERTDGWDWVLLVARLNASQRAEATLKALNLWEETQ